MAGGDKVELRGNFTFTPELTCRFNDTYKLAVSACCPLTFPIFVIKLSAEKGLFFGKKSTKKVTMRPDFCGDFQEIDTAMYLKDGVKRMRCIAPPHSPGYYTLEVSGNDQQYSDFGLLYVYDDAVWIWLIAGIVGFVGLLVTCCCANCWALMWKFRDYR